ncbi:hypothetical protein J2Z83_002886 [Virgibacillus natechei]|uniref:Transposase IS801/IS1294 domain-containing protein n=1 Tax=Virgibacillus natechei TaxID=1216297 RepID=A0ABS4IIG7_9BACI|nr:hypothetical protein [Virgibacillus natechei]
MRRPAIGINWIEAYDGHYVTFKYIDKKDKQEKRETLTVEAFISRLIRHIPDEQFKTIRYYGMYSRRSKSLSKKLLAAWQQGRKRWILKVKKTLRRQTWRERVISSGQKDPMICPHCDNYYEYKGEVCPDDGGRLEIKVALTTEARNYLERVIRHLEGTRQEPENWEEKKEERSQSLTSEEGLRQLSLFDVS